MSIPIYLSNTPSIDAQPDTQAAPDDVLNGRNDGSTEWAANAVTLIGELTTALEDLGNWLAYGLEKPDGAGPTAEDIARCEEVGEKAGAAVAKGYNFLGVARQPTFPAQVRRVLASEAAPELQYEDQLPATITAAEYDAWFAQSRVQDGVRVGPKFKKAASDESAQAKKHGWRYWYDNYQEMLDANAANIRLLQGRDSRITELEAQLARSAEMAATANWDRVQCNQQLVDAEARLKYHDDNFIRLTDERAGAIRRAENAETQLANARQQAEAFKSEWLGVAKQRDNLKAQLAEANARVEAAERGLVIAQELVCGLQAQLANVQHGFHHSKQAGETWRLELVSVTAQLAEAQQRADGFQECYEDALVGNRAILNREERLRKALEEIVKRTRYCLPLTAGSADQTVPDVARIADAALNPQEEVKNG